MNHKPTPFTIERNGMFRDRDNKIVSLIYLIDTPKANEEIDTNRKFVLGAINTHMPLVDIAQRCLFIFGNEANYPEGTMGYMLAEDVKKIFQVIGKSEPDTAFEDMVNALKRIETVYDWKEDMAGEVAHEVIKKHKL